MAVRVRDVKRRVAGEKPWRVASVRIMSSAAARYVRRIVSSKTFHPDGTVTTTRDLAVWTLAHRGYGGGGRLDVRVYPTRPEILTAWRNANTS